MKKITATLWFTVLFALRLIPQSSTDWTTLMQDPAANFYEVQKAFSEYWKDKDMDAVRGWKPYMRWEHSMRFRIDANGEQVKPELFWQELLQHNANKAKALRNNPSVMANTWTYFGNNNIPAGGGAGRLNCVRFHPTDPNTIYVGAPVGGLWKSTDGGSTWSTNTDQLSVIGVTDVAINPLDPNIMYLGTGDGDASDSYSVGVLKSIDGGVTWATTSLGFTMSAGRTIARILINPVNPNILVAATNNGIYRTGDAGVTWTRVLTANCKDLEFKPGNPDVIYAVSSSSFYRSVNGGLNFILAGTGLPTSSVNRKAVCVTQADSNYVYVLACKTDYGFEGLYRSVNGGSSFTKMSSTPNVLGWSNVGNDAGGQGWYDLAVAASHINKDEVFVGGVNIWKSTNGGTNWTIAAHWQGSGAPYVHADIHDLIYYPGTGTLFTGSDGGIFKTTNSGASWTDLSNGLAIAQIYRLGLSASDKDLLISGWQDNGTNRRTTGNNWAEVAGGDGMECIIDYSTDNIMYSEVYYGRIRKSTNGGNSFTTTIVNSNGTGVNEQGDWVTPYILHPSDPNSMLVGKNNVYQSSDGGTTWSQIGTIPTSSSKIYALAYALSDPDYIYASKANRLYVTTDGNTFTDRTPTNAPINNITYVTVHQNDPEKVWVTYSGYVSGGKVFYSSDAGLTWSNYSAGLPNIPARCIVYQNNSKNALYVGTDLGVYYRDSTMTGWVSYNNGLPNVIVDEMEIFYGTPKMLRAATYGRGVWEIPLYANGAVLPVAQFDADKKIFCPGASVQFTDNTADAPTAWSWSFPGGTPVSSTAQNPIVTYTASGTFDVTLVVTNAVGKDTLEIKNMITVYIAPAANAGPDSTVCAGTVMQLNGSGGITYYWFPPGGLSSQYIPSPMLTTTTTRTYTLTVSDNNGCSATDKVVITVSTPSTNAGPDVSACSGDSAKIAGSGAASYSWMPSTGLSSTTLSNPLALPTATTTYTLIGTDAIGCTKNDIVIVTVASYPAKPMITYNGDTLICTPPASNYQWYRNDTLIPGATSQKYLATINGKYVVMITENGCPTASDSLQVFVGLGEFNPLKIEFAIAPNPSKGYFDVTFDSPFVENITLEIKNTLGQVVYSESLTDFSGNYKKSLDISAYGKGVYFFSIRSGNGRGVKKVVVY